MCPCCGSAAGVRSARDVHCAAVHILGRWMRCSPNSPQTSHPSAAAATCGSTACCTCASYRCRALRAAAGRSRRRSACTGRIACITYANAPMGRRTPRETLGVRFVGRCEGFHGLEGHGGVGRPARPGCLFVADVLFAGVCEVSVDADPVQDGGRAGAAAPDTGLLRKGVVQFVEGSAWPCSTARRASRKKIRAVTVGMAHSVGPESGVSSPVRRPVTVARACRRGWAGAVRAGSAEAVPWAYVQGPFSGGFPYALKGPGYHSQWSHHRT